jgi:hypothetical protein
MRIYLRRLSVISVDEHDDPDEDSDNTTSSPIPGKAAIMRRYAAHRTENRNDELGSRFDDTDVDDGYPGHASASVSVGDGR